LSKAHRCKMVKRNEKKKVKRKVAATKRVRTPRLLRAIKKKCDLWKTVKSTRVTSSNKGKE